jgi:hypothetical protein
MFKEISNSTKKKPHQILLWLKGTSTNQMNATKMVIGMIQEKLALCAEDEPIETMDNRIN